MLGYDLTYNSKADSAITLLNYETVRILTP